MQIYIMRHGDAVAQANSDAERPLSSMGLEQANRMVEVLLEAPPGQVWVSPYLRAQQTAACIISGLSRAGVRTVSRTLEFITPDGHITRLLQELEEYEGDEPVLMVSHQPFVGSLITTLVEGHSMGLPVNTATIAALSCDLPGHGTAELQWMKSP